jgi:hypothetical protein
MFVRFPYAKPLLGVWLIGKQAILSIHNSRFLVNVLGVADLLQHKCG